MSEYEKYMGDIVKKYIENLSTSTNDVIHQKNNYSNGKYTKHEKMIIRNAAYPYKVIFKHPWYNIGSEKGPAVAYIRIEKRTLLTSFYEYIQDIFD